MPRPQPSGLHVNPSYTVASANSTLNTFMGGKQKSWMTNATAVPPSPRPPRPIYQPADNSQPPPQVRPPRQARRASRQVSPAILPNLLPSPAPSDEPSPSLSKSQDSPGLRSHALSQPQQNHLLSANAPAAQQPISPDSCEQAEAPTGTVSQNATIETDSIPTTQTVADQTQSGAHSPQVMPPPRLFEASQPEQAMTMASVALPVDPSNRVQPRSGPDGGPPTKKRRIDATTPDMDRIVTELAKAIDQKVELLGGFNMLNDIERPRFLLLKDACLKRDLFYLHLHSMYCTWFIDPSKLPHMLRHDMKAVHQGFAVLQSVLKQNDQLARPTLEWFANFLHPGLHMMRPTMVAMVAQFLTTLPQHWSHLIELSVKRQYPLLVDELLGKLHCFSVVMQGILFTACRRSQWLIDSELDARMQRYFEQDQRGHLDQRGEFFSVSLSDDEVVRRNQPLIKVYRQLVEAAKKGHSQRVLQHFQQFQQPPSPAQNGAASITPNLVASRTRLNDAHHVANQTVTIGANQARRASFHSSSPVMQPSNQTPAWPQQTSNSNSITGSPNMTYFQFNPQASGYSPLPVSSNLVLPSSTAMPNLSDAAMMQMVANQQLQPQVPSGQQYHANSMAQERARQAQIYIQQQYMSPGHMQPQQAQMRIQQHHLAPGQLQTQQAQLHIQQQSRSPGQSQWSQVVHQPFGSNPHGQQTRFHGHTQSFHGHFIQQTNGYQLNHPGPHARGAMVQQQVSQQVPPMALNNAKQGLSQAAPLVPRSGQIIDRSQYPHSHQERRSLFMAIHQAHARSPERTGRSGGINERYYQSVLSFAVAPFQLAYVHELNIVVTSEQHSRLCRKKTLPHLGSKPVTTVVHEYTSGSLRFRVRCCRLQWNDSSTESDWVTKDCMWPEHIYIRFNDQSIPIRRGTHNGKDLPVELTDFVQSGTNKLQVVTSSQGPTAADKRGNSFYVAAEIVETASHSDVLKNVHDNGRVDRAVTLAKIRSRVNSVPDEDGITVIDRTGDTAQELSVDLTDPFSAKIFEVPARGASCTHMECFDLETWLVTRPTKQQIKCGHKDVCTCPKRIEPSEPDKWKCPICFGDARPGSLRIDGFLEDVRKQLLRDSKLDTKSILVAADGTWRSVIEPADDDYDSDVDGPAPQRTSATLRAGPSKSASIERMPVEVIELD